MQGVNFVRCPRCDMNVTFRSGETLPPETCPHCEIPLDEPRDASCKLCGSAFVTAAAAGADVACPSCGGLTPAPTGSGTVRTVRMNVPTRTRVEGAPTVERQLEDERRRRKRVFIGALVGGSIVAAMAAAGTVFALAGWNSWSTLTRIGAGAAALGGAVGWVFLLRRLSR